MVCLSLVLIPAVTVGLVVLMSVDDGVIGGVVDDECLETCLSVS